MLEGLICPVCENTIEEVDLRHSLKCPHCSANLKSRKFLDFLEFLMANGIVENLDFFEFGPWMMYVYGLWMYGLETCYVVLEHGICLLDIEDVFWIENMMM